MALQDEFIDFINNFEVIKSSQLVPETPLLDLEQFEGVEFKIQSHVGKTRHLLLSNTKLKCSDITFNSLTTYDSIKPIKLSFSKIERRKFAFSHHNSKFRITTISEKLHPIGKFFLNHKAQIVKKEFQNLHLIDFNGEFEIGTKANLDIRKQNFFLLKDPDLSIKSFWMDLFPVNLSPIAPIHVKELYGQHPLLLKFHSELESLREVQLNTNININCEVIDLEVPNIKREFRKQCIVNADSLRNDAIIEALQYRDWLIFERPTCLEGLQMFQVSEKVVVIYLSIGDLKDLLENIKNQCTEFVKVIIEVTDQKSILENNAEFIILRDLIEDVYISDSLEKSIKFIEMFAEPFNFQSEESMSEFFTAIQALHYLQKYSNEPGIQYYLCERLKELPAEDVEALIPQLCHLAVMNTNESAPIEHFLLDRVKESLHISIQILWILENYLYDLKNVNRSAGNYLKAARILLEVQKASFKHEISDSAFQNTKKQLARAYDHLETFYGATGKPNGRNNGNSFLCTGPPIIAFGAMVSSLACPQMVKTMQPLIAMQTKKSDPFDRFHNHISNKLRVSPILPVNPNITTTSSSPCPSTTTNSSDSHTNYPPSQQSESSGPSLEELSKGKAFSLKRYITKTAKSAKTLLSGQVTKSPPLPLMSNEMIEGIPATPPATLFPTLPFYYHGEMQFVSSLIAVSDRLITLTRPNRLKAFHAELCLINHNLPAPICVHSWCNEPKGHHHRILSIFPYESSILNSAERVPYIIFIEILRDGCSEEDFNILMEENRRNLSENEVFNMKVEESALKSPESLVPSPDSPIQMASIETCSIGSKSNAIATASGLVDVSERMRTAAVMLAQLARQSQVPNADLVSINTIRNRIIHEMETLEKDRLIDVLQAKNSKDFYDDQVVRVESHQRPNFDKQDPSAVVFQEDWDIRRERLARASVFSHLPGWDVFSVIVKSSTDMRQELLAFQLVREYQKIFKDANLSIFVRPCKVLVGPSGGGLIETVPNSISIHSIKKGILMNLGRTEFTPEDLSLKGYFIRKYGTPDSQEYLDAVENFIKSLAGYSLLTYTLQIRDRHNGNILLDRLGHLIHIDFGFMLSNSPGYVGFESAPFKLTADYLDLLEGMGSERWIRLKSLLAQGLLALRKHSDQLISLLEVLLPNSNLPCFYAGEAALLNFKERLHLSLTDQQIDVLIDRLMTTSALNVFTRLYDNYQYYTNGIL